MLSLPAPHAMVSVLLYVMVITELADDQCPQMEELQADEIPQLEERVRENSAQVETLKSGLQQASHQWWYDIFNPYQLVAFAFLCRQRQRRVLSKLTSTKSANSSLRLGGWRSYELISAT